MRPDFPQLTKIQISLVSQLWCPVIYIKRIRKRQIGHFTVVCLVAWPLNESEAGVETSLLFLCKLLLVSMKTTSLT